LCKNEHEYSYALHSLTSTFKFFCTIFITSIYKNYDYTVLHAEPTKARGPGCKNVGP